MNSRNFEARQVHEWCRESKIIPVLSIANLKHAVPVAKALASGGIKLVEITLRTDCALDAIAQVREQVPQLLVAAGTVRTPADVFAAKESNAHFAISPGTTSHILDAAFDSMLPIMPGVATASEAMQWSHFGLNTFKFFPAGQMGGVATLQAFYPPLPDIYFCPTGGIREENARSYLDMPNVVSVGGSWLVTKEHYANENWESVTEIAKRAMTLCS